MVNRLVLKHKPRLKTRGRTNKGLNLDSNGDGVLEKISKLKNVDPALSLNTININKTLMLSKRISKGKVVIGKTNSSVSMKRTVD